VAYQEFGDYAVGGPTNKTTTLEAAAIGDIPRAYVRILNVSISPEGKRAIVTFETNEGPSVELYESCCAQEDDEWYEQSGSGGLGCGWLPWSIEPYENVGVLRLTGEVSQRVKRVRISWNDQEYNVAAMQGYFFFTIWNVPEDYEKTIGIPRIVSYIDE
jgi:hypothetical protein